MTGVDLAHAVRILEQNTGTVTVRLTNAWTPWSSSSSGTADNSIFYSYQHSVFDEKCYQKDAVRGGEDYDDITIRCLSHTPIAKLGICVADHSNDRNNNNNDDGGTDTEPFLDRDGGDTARPPRCCHADLPDGTPTVCYTVLVRCETSCRPGEDGEDPGDHRSSLLRGRDTTA